MEKIKQLFAVIFQVDPKQVDKNTTPQDLDSWTSINHLNLISSFEQEFGINIEPEEIILMAESFGKLQEIIISKLHNHED